MKRIKILWIPQCVVLLGWVMKHWLWSNFNLTAKMCLRIDSLMKSWQHCHHEGCGTSPRQSFYLQQPVIWHEMNKNFNIGPSNQRERNRFEPHSISFDILHLIYQFFTICILREFEVWIVCFIISMWQFLEIFVHLMENSQCSFLYDTT